METGQEVTHSLIIILGPLFAFCSFYHMLTVLPPYCYNHIGLIQNSDPFHGVFQTTLKRPWEISIKLVNLRSVLFTYLVHQVLEEE